MHRLAKPLVFLVIAAQLLIAIPAVASSASQASADHCSEMAKSQHGDDCPCCSDDASSMNCLVSCMLAAAAPVHVSATSLFVVHFAPTLELPAFSAVDSDPPLKPPPIY